MQAQASARRHLEGIAGNAHIGRVMMGEGHYIAGIRPGIPPRRRFINRLLSCAPGALSCVTIALGLIAFPPFLGQAAEIDGVQFPSTMEVNGKTLLLNGYGQRNYLLGIHIYVAGLYVEHLSTNPEQIIHSPETKLLTIRFVHDVSADEGRDAWRDGFEKNCRMPCQLDPQDIARFLEAIPAMHVGDTYYMLFTPNGANVSLAGHELGYIPKLHFAQAMLASFLGPEPASEKLKHDLLDRHD